MNIEQEIVDIKKQQKKILKFVNPMGLLVEHHDELIIGMVDILQDLSKAAERVRRRKK